MVERKKHEKYGIEYYKNILYIIITYTQTQINTGQNAFKVYYAYQGCLYYSKYSKNNNTVKQ